MSAVLTVCVVVSAVLTVCVVVCLLCLLTVWSTHSLLLLLVVLFVRFHTSLLADWVVVDLSCVVHVLLAGDVAVIA